MNTKRIFSVAILLLFFLSTASCGGNQNVDVAVIVALTQTAMALEQQSALPTATSSPTQQDYTPFSAGDCSTLNTSLSASTGVQGEITPSVAFDDYVNSKKGSGCQIRLEATGQIFQNIGGIGDPAEDTMTNLGWQKDARYDAAGPGGYHVAYAKEKNLCFITFETSEIDPSLCPPDQPVVVCWEKLAPEQMIYRATLNCAQANFP